MLDFINNQLTQIKQTGLYRELKRVTSPQGRNITINGSSLINFSSNNYLDLTSNSEIIETIKNAVEYWGCGSGASRLISGNLKCYDDLEREIASLKKREAALVFPTGYMTNTGIISALANEDTALIIDRLNHASIIDGTKLSKSRRFVYKHCDMFSLEKVLKRTQKYKYRLIVTDTIFSMDGDGAPLNDIVELCNKYNANLIVDEAHAFGVFGEKGEGLMAEYNLSNKAFLDMGTFSKAAGSIGGYIACDNSVREYLINTSRSLIYTTGLPPYVIEANRKAVEVIQKSNDKRIKLKEMAKTLRDKLNDLGFDTAESISQIIPIIIGDNKATLSMQDYLLKNGMYVPAIRFPTVPKGTARLRISLTSDHRESDIEQLVSVLKDF